VLGLRPTGKGDDQDDDVPFELKLDMARQCWDEARHCRDLVKLSDWMGTEIGEFAENTVLYEAACNPDPVLRLTGVNRALEGLAIDVFNTMRSSATSPATRSSSSARTGCSPTRSPT
jgi:hypothetical protein